MTEPTPSSSEELDVTVGAGQDGSTDLSDPSTPSDLKHPGVGYEAVESPQRQLHTFDEMLPATRAFYRKS